MSPAEWPGGHRAVGAGAEPEVEVRGRRRTLAPRGSAPQVSLILTNRPDKVVGRLGSGRGSGRRRRCSCRSRRRSVVVSVRERHREAGLLDAVGRLAVVADREDAADYAGLRAAYWFRSSKASSSPLVASTRPSQVPRSPVTDPRDDPGEPMHVSSPRRRLRRLAPSDQLEVRPAPAARNSKGWLCWAATPQASSAEMAGESAGSTGPQLSAPAGRGCRD